MNIGITERGDAAYNIKWKSWVKKGNPAILITKNPGALINQLNDIDNPNIIIHVNITGNSGTVMEPEVPDYKESLDALYYLINKYGKDRVVLRIDPIIPIDPYLKNSYNVFNEAKLYLGKDMPRVRISFLDNYKHVKFRMKEAGLTPFDYQFHAPLKDRQKIWSDLNEPELCGEEGMPSTSCVSEIDCKILGVDAIKPTYNQRKECGCLGNKHELLDQKMQCPSKCIYCYWKNKNEE